MIKKILFVAALNFVTVLKSNAQEMSPIEFNRIYGHTILNKTKVKKPFHNIRHKFAHISHVRHTKIVAMVIDSAKRHNVPVKLALGVAYVESGFRSISNGRAYGVMQILPATARTVGCSSNRHRLLEPSYGIECGMRYLSRIYHSSRSVWVAAAKYNQGEGSRYIVRKSAKYANKVVAFQ